MHVAELQSLEAAQLPGAVLADVMMQVVEPVVAMMMTPEEMDITGVGPEPIMGPGMPVPSEEMLLVLNADERIKQRDEEQKQRWLKDLFQHLMDSVDTEDLDDTTEK